jgi:hypothetical protein
MDDLAIIAKALCAINNKLAGVLIIESIKMAAGANSKELNELIDAAGEGALSYESLKGGKK